MFTNIILSLILHYISNCSDACRVCNDQFHLIGLLFLVKNILYFCQSFTLAFIAGFQGNYGLVVVTSVPMILICIECCYLMLEGQILSNTVYVYICMMNIYIYTFNYYISIRRYLGLHANRIYYNANISNSSVACR